MLARLSKQHLKLKMNRKKRKRGAAHQSNMSVNSKIWRNHHALEFTVNINILTQTAHQPPLRFRLQQPHTDIQTSWSKAWLNWVKWRLLGGRGDGRQLQPRGDLRHPESDSSAAENTHWKQQVCTVCMHVGDRKQERGRTRGWIDGVKVDCECAWAQL